MRRIADGFQIVLEPVVHRDERDLDELRVPVDGFLQVGQVNAALFWHHHANVEPSFLPLHQVHQRALEVQAVGDDVVATGCQAEALDHEVLTGARVTRSLVNRNVAALPFAGMVPVRLGAIGLAILPAAAADAGSPPLIASTRASPRATA